MAFKMYYFANGKRQFEEGKQPEGAIPVETEKVEIKEEVEEKAKKPSANKARKVGKTK